MNDPWKTFRLIIENENSVDITDAYDLLTDADALLTVVRAAQEWRDMRGKLVYATERELGKTLAALPKHLTHEHEWIDPSNEYVSGGALCLGCGEIRAETPEQLRIKN